MDSGPADPLRALATGAEPRRARLRVGLGAAVVLLLVGLACAVLVYGLTPAGSSSTVIASENPAAITGEDADGAADASRGEDPSGLPATNPVFVHVLGAIVRPGLYEVGEGARVIDVVASAGGFAEGADQARVNLARVVSDGEQLYVPTVGEAALPPPHVSGDGTGGSGGSPLVNLNTATVLELDTLPRIGPGLAQRILDWREQNGRFSSAEDLLGVPGIGEKIFEGLRERVTV